jgi:hypothetical protein
LWTRRQHRHGSFSAVVCRDHQNSPRSSWYRPQRHRSSTHVRHPIQGMIAPMVISGTSIWDRHPGQELFVHANLLDVTHIIIGLQALIRSTLVPRPVVLPEGRPLTPFSRRPVPVAGKPRRSRNTRYPAAKPVLPEAGVESVKPAHGGLPHPAAAELLPTD